ncbi:MAG TPA: erythromycin biosynthesis sensory transduction protein eryC1 [Acidobacteria bacterium]|nr:erythromycin biosynthesis sensory transduction protein eryC1 [Acidobacteriota bacterium]
MIPMVDLRAQYASIKEEVDAAVLDVLASGQFALGPQVSAFEEEFAAYSGARYGVAVNSGTSALHLALLAAGVGPSDEVITVPFTFMATVAAVRYTGATPVFVDIEPRSCTMDVAQVRNAITDRTSAIIPVHLYGQPADLGPLLNLAREHHLTIIEDAAQAHGAEYRGRRVGGLGDFGCFSFYPGKNLGAYGEGGLVVTNDEGQAKALRSLRNWGEDQPYKHERPVFNYRMDNIQGAILRVKLRHLPAWTEARRRLAVAYDEALTGTGVVSPTVMPYAHHVYHLYAIQSSDRDRLHRALGQAEIQTGRHYPAPVHLHAAHADLGGNAGDHPHSETAAQRTLTLPIYPEMPSDVPERVAGIIRETLSS